MINEFYEDLEKFMKGITRKDVLVVQGDWNGKISQDAYGGWRGTIGRLGETNDSGLKLLDLAKRHTHGANYVLNHQRSGRTTWHSIEVTVHNQINFFISRRYVTELEREVLTYQVLAVTMTWW